VQPRAREDARAGSHLSTRDVETSCQRTYTDGDAVSSVAVQAVSAIDRSFARGSQVAGRECLASSCQRNARARHLDGL